MDTKALSAELARRLNREEDDINMLCTELGAIIADIAADGGSVAIPTFGSFEPKKRAERVSVHPASGKRILIPPKLSLVFKPSASLKSKVK